MTNERYIRRCDKAFCCIYIGILIFYSVSCKKIVEIQAPVTSISQENVFSSDATAISALTGIYASMSGTTTFTGNASITVFTGLSADELSLYNGVTTQNYIAYYKNTLISNSSNSYGSEFWKPLYNYIFNCNLAIEGLSSSTTLTNAVKQQLLGEAKFLRAYFYFYLVNLFGDVPVTLSTDPKINSSLARSSKNEVYQQIVEDLLDAESLLSENYLNGTLQPYASSSERTRPTKWAATALLARVYLYTKDYSNSELEATKLINETNTFGIVSLDNVFLKNSKEAVWQLQPVKTGRNTEDGITFIIPSTGPSNPNGTAGNPVYLSTDLLGAFESTDQRKLLGKWINSIKVNGVTYYFPYKYKLTTFSSGTATEYLMVLRLAEQYLIRAEAKAMLSDINGGASDLNMIRSRAGLGKLTFTSKEDLLTAILHERHVELFTELGARWLDIKRLEKVDAVMNNAVITKGTAWNSYQQLYPLPFVDLEADQNLSQNPNY